MKNIPLTHTQAKAWINEQPCMVVGTDRFAEEAMIDHSRNYFKKPGDELNIYEFNQGSGSRRFITRNLDERKPSHVKAIGQLIQKMRQYRGLTQVDLATALNVDQSYISHLEAGRNNVSIEVLVKVAEALNCIIDVRLTPAETPTSGSAS